MEKGVLRLTATRNKEQAQTTAMPMTNTERAAIGNKQDHQRTKQLIVNMVMAMGYGYVGRSPEG
jgi:hypothetical protein